MAGGEIGFDPVAQSEQRAPGTGAGRRDAGAERHRPVVPKRLLPDERDVRVRGAGDLDLIERQRRPRGCGGRLRRSPLRGRRRGTARRSGCGRCWRDPPPGSSGTPADWSRRSGATRSTGAAAGVGARGRWIEQRARHDALARHRVDQRALQRRPDVRAAPSSSPPAESDTSRGAAAPPRTPRPCRRALFCRRKRS